MSDRSARTIGIVIGGILILCLCCVAVAASSAFALRDSFKNGDIFAEYGDFELSTDPTPTAQILEEWQTSEEGKPLAEQTLETLENAMVPENDPADLATRLGGIEDVPELVPDPDAPHEVGETMNFWITNTATNISSQQPAVLRYVTEHAYFWVGEGISYDEDDLAELADSFENHIYPTTREFFGSEWNPGIDGDEHIYILYVTNVGFSTAGYFSSADSVHPLAHEYSNAHEVFVFNADNSPLSDEYTYGVLAHEFQHMIHWYRDRNESSWINEGFSEVSTLLNGFDPGGFDFMYTGNPDLQLNDWPNDSAATTPHYGASFLFMTYFLDRMGKEVSQALVKHPENGMKSIDLLLEEIDARDPLTNASMRADDLVIDWALTNYLLDEKVMDGRFVYRNYSNAPRTYETETLYDCEPGLQPRTVHQYGVDYIRITCPGSHTLRFEGAQKTTLLPEPAYSGDFSFWSNKGDESDMTLTRQFDFRGLEGPITFSFRTWYDIEEDYDYIYLLASTDGNAWEILQTPSGTDEDPSGNSFGWGYNGLSGGDGSWIQEEVDLSQFAGQQVWLRFEYVTDAAVNGEGMLLDDFAITAIGYFNDLEEDEGGWQGAGFVRVPNLLPQTFRLALVQGEGWNARVEYLTLEADNSLELPLEIAGSSDEVTLVVIGTTRYTRQLAPYQFDFLP
ncbi:MAG: immune inhibitor A [Anaerolineales bacterium]|nr:immune inhibitor A [Anaerolineales bacterium]